MTSTTVARPTQSLSPDRPLLATVGADLRVPLVSGTDVGYVNLDHAASSPALRAVAEHLTTVLPYYASVHRGAGYPSSVTSGLYEQARVIVSGFADARATDTAVFTRNTTDALNLLAHCLPRGARVVSLETEHHANLLPWASCDHRLVRAAPTWAETLGLLERELTAAPVHLLAITGVSNVTGEVVPVAEVVRLAHRHGARVVVDGAQLVPHRRFSLASSGADYVAFSGHKLYAPYGSGVLIGPRDWLDAATPYLRGGGAVREVDVEHTSWAAAPERHEAGTPNVLGGAALARACEVLGELDPEHWASHERALRERLESGLRAIPGVRTLRIWPDVRDAVGIVAFVVAGTDPGLAAAYLAAEHGIGVRSGRFCAHPLLARLGAPPGGALRASFGVPSTLADVDRLLDALSGLVTHGPKWTYETVSGRWTPVPDPRPVPQWAGRATAVSPCEADRPGGKN
ncbi:aminotransferase class V-fold PLP-dependent enzyme [Streptomyces sp. ISL-100]|uniref:aminotransferase class V-fold PLP-dependent enzyme n=1 Tax=Streptomyces sp. ISL-100 TaxID=2819173 RepID=UPI001BE4E703|nr:aminotransferase class V-fold PLP-dependent enzyme [Streptomyces sp. ISL-100]MBT2400805.1 aminotransferase class V-fold PLP-dependent enzyme [Streptomyces sp. ISL-100]